MSKCKGCGADIVWIKTTAGKAMPCDAEPKLYKADKRGKAIFITPNGETIKGSEVFQPEDIQKATGVGYIPHWATCPAAKTFKKNKGEMEE